MKSLDAPITIMSLMIELSATERASVVEHIAEMFCLSCGAPRKDRCACLRDELEELQDESSGDEWKGHA